MRPPMSKPQPSVFVGRTKYRPGLVQHVLAARSLVVTGPLNRSAGSPALSVMPCSTQPPMLMPRCCKTRGCGIVQGFGPSSGEALERVLPMAQRERGPEDSRNPRLPAGLVRHCSVRRPRLPLMTRKSAGAAGLWPWADSHVQETSHHRRHPCDATHRPILRGPAGNYDQTPSL